MHHECKKIKVLQSQESHFHGWEIPFWTKDWIHHFERQHPNCLGNVFLCCHSQYVLLCYLLLITTLELRLPYAVRGQRSVSDPTSADQCRVSALMRVSGGSYTMDTMGPALPHWYHIHLHLPLPWNLGLQTSSTPVFVSFSVFPTATNKGKKEKHTQRRSQTFLLHSLVIISDGWKQWEGGISGSCETQAVVLGSACSVNLSEKRFYFKPRKQTIFIAVMFWLGGLYAVKPLNTGLYQVTWENFFFISLGLGKMTCSYIWGFPSAFSTHQMSASVLKVVDNMSHLKQWHVVYVCRCISILLTLFLIETCFHVCSWPHYGRLPSVIWPAAPVLEACNVFLLPVACRWYDGWLVECVCWHMLSLCLIAVGLVTSVKLPWGENPSTCHCLCLK